VELRRIPRIAVASAALVAYAFAYPHTPVNSGRGYSNLKQHAGIADERGVFFNDTSLYKYAAHVNAEPGEKLPYFPDQASAKRGYELGRGPHKLSDTTMIGFFGYSAGTKLMIVDRLGLADPLFARLPVENRASWRIGHFKRAAVPGYYESIVYGEPLIKDPAVNDLYRNVRLVTRGPLFSPERWKAIVAMNL
jgi:arabinofuranosyltransferase